MQHADLNILQSEREGDTLKVEQVRELQHMLSLAPYEGGYRIALLLRFEEANDSAQNALLKTLEEPNPRVILLATADDSENLRIVAAAPDGVGGAGVGIAVPPAIGPRTRAVDRPHRRRPAGIRPAPGRG
jgi:hypothetical protein